MSVQDLPIADPHVHANGMLVDETVRELADKYKVDLRTYSPYILPNGQRTWPGYPEFHRAYDAGVSLIRQPEDLFTVVKRNLVETARDNGVYEDIFSSNMNNYRPEERCDPWPIFRDNSLAALQAMKEAHLETGIESSLVITFKRHLKDAVKAAHQLVDLTLHFKEKGLDPENRLNAFHLAGDESSDKCPSFLAFEEIYQRAAIELGMNRNGTHVGEKKPADHMWQALMIKEVSRFGHGLSASQDEKLMRAIRENGVAIEILLSSNEQLLRRKAMEHEIHTFMNRKLDVILGSDDPGLLRSSIANEYRKASEEYGLTDQQLFGITTNAVRHGFAPWWRRQNVLDRLSEYNISHRMDLDGAIFHLEPPKQENVARRQALTVSLHQRFALNH